MTQRRVIWLLALALVVYLLLRDDRVYSGTITIPEDEITVRGL